MTQFFNQIDAKPITLSEVVDYLDTEVDFNDLDSIKEAAPTLQRLAKNPNWFIDLINTEVENNVLSDKKFKNVYTSNSTLLGRSKVGKPYFLRTNVWLPENDPLRTGMNRKFFAEDFYHDHSFDLLTVGLLGSGYRTNIRHYDYETTIGYVGEVVHTFDNRQYQLKAGTALFMEKHKTIHQQVPPDETSVSFNLMLDNIKNPRSRQYEFEMLSEEQSRVKALHYNGYRYSYSVEYLVAMAMNYYDSNTIGYLTDLYKRLIEDPKKNEPLIILLNHWFRKVGLASVEIPIIGKRLDATMAFQLGRASEVYR
ncbi:hypothetical protein I6M33_18775 [Shewanella algae]|uniref:hypothetical protein n=1 Tax=Shewanella algae TaxID=38313 RepID=UPI001AAD3A34|nr:hypothetical protein [Shewanella algae]MBO2562626.1 hypothetical protein [Shewanella algae]MBO2621918.1 hypothetical protein [Shewanella algae]